ncbi:MAG: hypothetical protein M3Y87_20125 [Myxococcota bacterium]|nr:hypothetical protein [Myxococcota bacterium]
MRLHLLSLAILCASCASAETTVVAPDASIADASVDLDAHLTCVPPFVDEGDACVAWRVIPDPPCDVVGVVRMAAEIAVRCADGAAYALLPAYVWEARDGEGSEIDPPRGDEPEAASPFSFALVMAERPDGSRIATHSDVYAHPAAWRTRDDGTWRETLAPPSAFIAHGVALSRDEVLFVGSVAYVHVRTTR